MTVKPYSEAAIFISFEEKIDKTINAKVHQLSKAIQNAAIKGITFVIPAYCSLTVGYDFRWIKYADLALEIEKIYQDLDNEKIEKSTKKISIPVCYDAPYSLDLEELSGDLQLSKEDIIHLHTSQIYQVFMMGFLPGFLYLGTLPEALKCQRKSTPRLQVPALSVGLAGLQTGIYPSTAPGGWQIIGRTPTPIFTPNAEKMFLLEAGDEVQFYAISKEAFEELNKHNH